MDVNRTTTTHVGGFLVDELVPDDELLAAYRAGNEDAASALFERYYARLLKLIRQQMGWRLKEVDSSADVAQSALQSFFVQLKDGRIEVSAGKTLWPLLVTITLNKVRNRGKFWERQRRDPSRRVPLSQGSDPLVRGPTPEDAAVLQELIERLLAPFSGRRRRIVQLILEGCSIGEIAEQVGTTERTIYSTRQAAAKILDRVLDSE